MKAMKCAEGPTLRTAKPIMPMDIMKGAAKFTAYIKEPMRNSNSKQHVEVPISCTMTPMKYANAMIRIEVPMSFADDLKPMR